MSAALQLLTGDALILTDGGIETRLMFELDVPVPEPLGSAGLIGTEALRAVSRPTSRPLAPTTCR